MGRKAPSSRVCPVTGQAVGMGKSKTKGAYPQVNWASKPWARGPMTFTGHSGRFQAGVAFARQLQKAEGSSWRPVSSPFPTEASPPAAASPPASPPLCGTAHPLDFPSAATSPKHSSGPSSPDAVDRPSGPRVLLGPAPEPSSMATPVPPGNWNSYQTSTSSLGELPPASPTVARAQAVAWGPFPTVDVPSHAHYTLGTVILLVGLTGMLGNLTVIYTFCRSRSLRTPANMFIINLAVSDLFMSVTQAPIFFTSSLYKQWIFGETGCEFYAFCGALFGITSMITLMAISLDRYLAITHPLATVGMVSKRRAALVLLGVWLYALAWSLPPFFGWSAYVPEGLLTSCSWDYMSFTPSVRAYTMLLFCFVFFLPLLVIVYCYVCIFKAIRETGGALRNFGTGNGASELPRRRRQLQGEWKTAKIMLLVTLLFVLSWAPYSTVALVAFAGYAHVLTPYMNSVPAVIAKASAIHNPIVYAITHPKYRMAIAQHLPALGLLLGVSGLRPQPGSSYRFTLRSPRSSQTSHLSWISGQRRQASLGSESEGGWTDTEAAAAWGAARQLSGPSPYGQGLEDTEVQAPPRRWRGEAETAGKAMTMAMAPWDTLAVDDWGLSAQLHTQAGCSSGPGNDQSPLALTPAHRLLCACTLVHTRVCDTLYCVYTLA
ncbi:melanopsin [Tamandua tetradactyla]|uniref:melanopsin n=1 Tax=Tamandua tetradactyla TaxID=48850 RepID=UPI0040545C09